VSDSSAVEKPDGVFRTTLSYTHDTMICHFRMSAGAEVPSHSHEAAQTGYVISGKVEFELGENGESFVATAGTGYSFNSWESHRAKFLEDSELIEVFAPARPEFMDD